MTCSMRVAARGNLTVELIRQQRFGPDGHGRIQPTHGHAHPHPHHPQCKALCTPDADAFCHRADKVELSRQALGCDPWAVDACRRDLAYTPAPHHSHEPTPPQPIDHDPRPITPVVGSPARAGLGVALIVPGTLLDVVA